MKMNKLMTGAFALTVATSATLPAFADGETPPPPVVSGVTMTQASDRLVTITYTLADAPAVVTVDIQTNATGDVWASIGGEKFARLLDRNLTFRLDDDALGMAVRDGNADRRRADLNRRIAENLARFMEQFQFF